MPPPKPLTTLGWLKYLQDPHFAFWEHHYLKYLHWNLTANWWVLQGGSDDRALESWLMIMRVLELDRKAMVDLFLLAQSGIVGRTYANKVLWDLMSVWALDPTYEDLSNKVSSEVGWWRRSFERPPRAHQDLNWWRWHQYDEPHYARAWSPLRVPGGRWDLQMGPGGRPLPPPACWGPAHQ